jgi:hypothetical protein
MSGAQQSTLHSRKQVASYKQDSMPVIQKGKDLASF